MSSDLRVPLGWKRLSYFFPGDSELDKSTRPLNLSSIHSADSFIHIFQELDANDTAVTLADKNPYFHERPVWIRGSKRQ